MPEQLARAPTKEETVMGSVQRIRPGRTAHREWFAALDADSKATVKANVEQLVAEGLAQPDAWDRVYDSDQQSATQQTPAEGAISDLLSDDGEELVEHAQREVEPTVDVPKGARVVDTKTGKLPEHLTKALGALSSIVDPTTGKLYVMRGEQQRVVDALRRYVDAEDVKDHVAWSIESVIGKVRSLFHKVVDKGENVNVRAIDAMIERDVQFEVVMRSDGSPTYKVGDVTMSAREALKSHSEPEAVAS